MRLLLQFRSFVLLVLLVNQTTIAQTKKESSYINSDFFSNFIPNSPSQSSLGSFGNVPINYYTRLPEVNLNLLTLSSRELNLPITVNYDASGVRLDDIAGPVGLKWSLNAGGFIARTVNGLPDENPTNGYWKFQNELNGSLSSSSQWVTNSETNAKDSEPDEFVMLISGRSLKFYIKNGKPIILPNQNVSIRYTVIGDKLNKFEVITEDGTKYIFGSNANSIEERKVETMNVSVNYQYDYKQDTFEYSDSGHGSTEVLATFFLGNTLDIYQAKFSERIGAFYNSKWYLTQIMSPSGDQINFNYVKSGTQKYASQPFVSRIEPIVTQVKGYTYTKHRCYSHWPLGCLEYRYYTITNTPEFKIPAFSIFKDACPDYNTNCNNGYPLEVLNNEKDAYFEPVNYPVYPEGILINQSLITESVIRISNITTSVGNRLDFVSSSRTDLPDGIKYDKIELRNSSNVITKSIGFTYDVSDASKAGDYMWLSEAFLMSRISNPLPANTNNYAYHAQQYAPAAFNLSTGATNPSGVNAGLIKYAYEGLKDYNYKRLFLTQISEATNGLNQFMYSFNYLNAGSLKRRITPIQTVFGFVSYLPQTPASLPMQANSKALYTHATDPVSGREASYGISSLGLLNKVTYPTGGSTNFTWTGDSWSRLAIVEDKNENGLTVKKKLLTSLLDYSYASAILISYQNGELLPDKYRRYKISSSSPQNRTFNFTHGVPVAGSKTRVYDGDAAKYNGYEEYTYRVDNDIPTKIYASPKDKDVTGQELNYMETDIFPYPKKVEQDHVRGLLDEYKLFDKNGNLLRSQKNDYLVNPNSYQPLTIKGFNGGSFHNTSKYRYGWYTIFGDWVVLDKTTEKIYDQSALGDLTKFFIRYSNNTYDPTTLQLVQTESFGPDVSSRVIARTRYVTHPDYYLSASLPVDCSTQISDCFSGCSDIIDSQARQNCYNNCNTLAESCQENGDVAAYASSEAILLLRNAHQISTPVEVQNLINENGSTKIVSSIVYKYKKQGSPIVSVKPEQIWGMKRAVDEVSYKSSKVNNTTGQFEIDTKLRQLHSYNSYDQTTGNVLQQTTLSGISTAYQWGFNNSLVTSYTINPGAQQHVNLYDHKLLIGLNSMTDPNGRTVYYEYDQLNRLKIQKDHDRNITNRYRYHYVKEVESIGDQINVCCTMLTGTSLAFTSSADKLNYSGTSVYEWEFHDGTKSSNATAYYSYSSPGSYVVKLKKSNSEYPMVANVTKTVVINSSPAAVICSDGPDKIDQCGSIITYGSCTQPINRTPTSPTALKVTVSGGCSSSYTYFWEYQLNSGQWLVLGGNAAQVAAPSGFLYRTLGNYNIRCRVTDGCGNVVTSATVLIAIFRTGC